MGVLERTMCALALGGLIAPAVHAQSSVTIFDEYSKLIQSREVVGALGNDLFGEQVSMYSGSLEFQQTDISLPGNNALPMAVGRQFSPNQDMYPGGHFGDWQLEVPRMQAVFDSQRAWTVPVDVGHPASDAYLRCTNFGAPPAATGTSGGGTFDAQEYWQGNFLYVPGSGQQEVLRRSVAPAPTDGKSYPLVTKSGFAVGCLANLAPNSMDQGEGFEALSPDGIRYRFDHLVKRYHPALTKSNPGPVTARAPMGYLLRRQEVWLLPTLVTDRFGNTVTYQWNATDPWRLDSITASDGRQLIFSYLEGTHQIAAISDGTRSWTYNYIALNGTSTLESVTLPDASKWTFQLNSIRMMTPYVEGGSCGHPGMANFGPRIGTITHPSGAVGSFTVVPITFGRSWVPLDCRDMASGGGGEGGSQGYSRIPSEHIAPALSEKKLSGPGLPVTGLVWSYAYGTANACYVPGGTWPGIGARCAADAPVTRTVTVTDPEGVVTRYVFGNRFETTEGQLQRTDTGWNGSNAISTTTYAYAAPNAGPYPDPVGTSGQKRGDGYLATRHTPQRSKTIVQQGMTFSWQVDAGCTGQPLCFDVFARPTQVTRASTLGDSRTERTVYYDHSGKWVLGQLASVTCTTPTACGPSGIVMSEASYDPVTAVPVTVKAFGKLKQTLTYNTDGTLATVKDANNNLTTFGSWKRGIPQSIGYADSTGQSAVVDDRGWVASVTDEGGAATSYEYDAMGRLTLIQYPINDTVNWLNTTLVFEPVAVPEYGIPAGHWRQTVSTGNARKVSYFDALWRPVLTKELDATNGTTETLTKRFQRFAYDHDGRTTFTSYPGTTDTLATGIWTEYDALGRTTSVSQDSESGPLTTLTSYEAGFKTRVTNPKSQVTTTSYQAYDQPTYDYPTGIDHPEGASTEIHRNVFGNVTALRRRNATASEQVWRYYTYDISQQLCKTLEPETGATVYDYDPAGNLSWSAAGVANLGDTQACNRTEAWASGRVVSRTYDARNRLKTLAFPDSKGNQTWYYWPTGAVQTIVTDNDGPGQGTVTNHYSYNKRGLLTGESLQQGVGSVWGIGYGYSVNGHLASQTYPSGLSVAYAPNALGQATQAGPYAVGVQYYPNGGIKQFTYGNGIVHTMTQNARQLPARSTDSGGGNPLDLAYAYDGNANVASITDHTAGGRQSRSLTYDGLDRLTQATGPSFGTATYTYDTLDNLKTVGMTGGSQPRTYAYVYDAHQRLTNLTNGVGGATVVGLQYDPQGNLAQKNAQVYQFDFGNRLRNVPNKEFYRYDGHGRRVLGASLASGNILSQYSQSGQLLYQSDERQAKTTAYVQLGGSLVARVVNSTAPATPTLTVPGFNTTGSYTVSWNTVAGANGYALQEAVSGGAWTTVYSGTGTSKAFSGKTAGNYGYRVRACLNAGCSNWSGTSEVAVQFAPGSAPSLSVPATAAGGTYTVGWSAVSSATSYTLEESANGGAWTQAYTGTNLGQGYTGKPAGSYGYRVKACNPAGCGAYSATGTVQAVYLPAGAPTVSTPASNNTGSYTVSWSTVANVTSYQVEESANGGGWTLIHNAAGTSKAISGKGTSSYAYRARACNAAGCGGYSATATTQVTLPPTGAPTVTVPASNTTGSYTVSWTAVANATSYQVEEQVNGGGWTLIHNAAGTSKAISGKASGTYGYRARACNGGGCGPFSSVGSVTVTPPIPAVPTGLAVTYNPDTTPSQMNFTWNASGGATSYQLSGGGISYSGAATSYQTTMTNPSQYQYSVRACNAGGCSAWSVAVKAFPIW